MYVRVHAAQEVQWTPKPVWTRWREEKIPVPAENRTPFFQHVALSLCWELQKFKSWIMIFHSVTLWIYNLRTL